MQNILKKTALSAGITAVFCIGLYFFSYAFFSFSGMQIPSNYIVYADDDGGAGAGDGGSSGGGGGGGGDDGGAGAGDGGSTNPNDDGGAGAGDGGNTNPGDADSPAGDSSGSEEEAEASDSSTPVSPPSLGGGSGGSGGGSPPPPGGGAPVGGGGGFSPCCSGGSYPPNVVLFRGPTEQPLAFVTLSQIPYTGYEAGPFGAFIFWTLLTVWSMFIAYQIAVKRLHTRIYDILANMFSPAVPLEQIYRQNEEDIEKPVHTPPPPPPSIPPERSAEEVRHPEVYAHMPVAVTNVSDYVSAVPLFIGWIVEGKSEQAFNFLRSLRMTQKSAQDFIEKTVCELDDAYRCRLDKTSGANEHTTTVIGRLSNKDVESLIDALASGVDRSYGSEYTSAKVALVRALNAVGYAPKKEPMSGVQSAPARVGEPMSAETAERKAEKEPTAPLRSALDYTDDFVLAQINRLRK